jgi:putative tricarboxylic transport membrane protein
MRKWFLGGLVVVAASSAVAFAVHAQPALKMMIPANPGGGWDQTGRNLAAAMQSAKLVSSVQFDNKGGAGGTIGLAQFINSSKGDPNALMMGGMVMVGAIYLDDAPVNLTMVTPVARLTGEYEAIVVPTGSPHKNMADLVKAFKANPGGVSWGGGSAGGTDHILVGLIAKAVGADPAKINYVPFKGGDRGRPRHRRCFRRRRVCRTNQRRAHARAGGICVLAYGWHFDTQGARY